METDNKGLLLAAIDDYEIYTKSQRKLLAALLNLEVNGIVQTSVTSLSKLIGFTRAMSYIALEGLEKDGAIKKLNEKQARVSTFELNFTKLRNIEEIYIKKQNFIEKDTKRYK